MAIQTGRLDTASGRNFGWGRTLQYAGVRALARGAPLNTDDHPYLEYFVPGDLFFRVEDNARAMAEHLSPPDRQVVGASPAALRELRVETRDRERWLLQLDGSGS